MSDYISREAAVKIATKYGLANGSALGRHTGLADCIAIEIEGLPAADVEPVVRANWQLLAGSPGTVRCSNCGAEFEENPYAQYRGKWIGCPACRAKMQMIMDLEVEMMGEIMQLPETVEEFMQQYKIVDTQQVYTNGTELVPIFRMKQWLEAHKQRWIPCSERLPETNGEDASYFVYAPSFDAVDIADYHPDVDEWTFMGLPITVTHWMPLPEPPEEVLP